MSYDVITAPIFLCTKLEAFSDRGRGDYNSSKDIEDIVLIINGREQLLDECSREDQIIKDSLSACFTSTLDADEFMNALPGLLPIAARNRESIILSRMKALAEIACKS